jgi:hypothetical protein
VQRGKGMKFLADQMLEALTIKHEKDVFVAECKDGPTWNRAHRRLDAWVMEKSWAHPKMVGYEIKQFRSDFMNDNKWSDYLPLCNELYFVCPHGLIEKNEVPESTGLLWLAKNGLRLWTKKKAPYRKIEDPINLFKYILMCRVKIIFNPDEDRVKFYTQWVKNIQEKRKLGRSVAQEFCFLSAEIQKSRTEAVERANRLAYENERLKNTVESTQPSVVSNKLYHSLKCLRDSFDQELKKYEQIFKEEKNADKMY